MYSAAVCRTCLVSNRRMTVIRGTQVQHVFEKLISSEHDTGGMRVCYICYSQLQRCLRFVNMAKKAELVLKAAPQPGTIAPFKCTDAFLITPTKCLSLPVTRECGESLVSVKTEPIEVKEEENGHFIGGVKIEELSTPADITRTVKQEPREQFGEPFEGEHIAFESNSQTHKCHTCAKSFATKYKLKRHSTVHEAAKHTHRCLRCDRTFARRYLFEQHTSRCYKMLQHNLTSKGGRAPICPICNKILADLSSLKKHVGSHGVLPPYICDYCGKHFSHRSYICVHMRTHTKEKPFLCNICGKSFAQYGHLSTHMQCHARSRRHHCSICDKSYTVGSSLNKHIRDVHSGVSVSLKSEMLFGCE